MEVLINIPESVYMRLKAGDTNTGNAFHDTALASIVTGVVLPNGHGDLIDRDVAYNKFDEACCSWEGNLLRFVPAVIPADCLAFKRRRLIWHLITKDVLSV